MKKRKGVSTAAGVATMINAGMGREIIGFASDPRFVINRVPTGSLTMDRITGGGFPRGRHVELFGDYGALKTTIALMTMALAQQRGETCMLINGEDALDADYFRHLGGNPDDLLVSKPRTAEEAIKVLMLFADKGPDNPGAGIVTIDSVASMLPLEELAKDVEEGDDRTAGRARMMSRLLRRVTAVNDDTLFLWTNQIIDKVGRIPGTTTPGGRALKFYASIRVEMRNEKREKKPRKRAKKNAVVSTDTVVGKWVVIRAEKQKTARPELEQMLYFDFDRAQIDREMEIVTLGLDDGLITRRGNTFEYEDSDGDTWSGTEARFKKMIHDNEDLADELVWAIEENTRRKADMSEEGEEDDGEE